MVKLFQIKQVIILFLRTIMGNISVFAKSYNHLAKIECEDTALIIFKFKNNKSAIMEATIYAA